MFKLFNEYKKLLFKVMFVHKIHFQSKLTFQKFVKLWLKLNKLNLNKELFYLMTTFLSLISIGHTNIEITKIL